MSAQPTACKTKRLLTVEDFPATMSTSCVSLPEEDGELAQHLHLNPSPLMPLVFAASLVRLSLDAWVRMDGG